MCCAQRILHRMTGSNQLIHNESVAGALVQHTPVGSRSMFSEFNRYWCRSAITMYLQWWSHRDKWPQRNPKGHASQRPYADHGTCAPSFPGSSRALPLARVSQEPVTYSPRVRFWKTCNLHLSARVHKTKDEKEFWTSHLLGFLTLCIILEKKQRRNCTKHSTPT